MANHPAPVQSRPDLTAPWWVIGLLALAFVVLAIVSRGLNTLRHDLWTTRRVQTFDGPLAEALAWFGDHLGERAVAIAFLAVAWVGLALLKRRRELWFVSLVAIGRLLGMFLKEWFDSPRPTDDQVEVVRVFDQLGFPSGHATTSAVFLGSIAFVVARVVPGRRGRLLLLALWILGMALTAYARIWYGAHWLTDTLGGAIAGLVIVLVAANVSATIVKKQSTAGSSPQSHPSAR